MLEAPPLFFADPEEPPLFDFEADEADFDEDDREVVPVLLVLDLLVLPEDLDPPAVLEGPPAEALLLREPAPFEADFFADDLLADALLGEALPAEVFPLALFPEDLDAPLFAEDDLLLDDEDDEALFEAADFFAPVDDRDEPVEPLRFVPVCEPTPPVISAAVDAAPITAPFAAPVASSVTTFAASSSTLVTVLLPEDFREPDVLLFVFAAILLASFFCSGAHSAPCVYSQRARA